MPQMRNHNSADHLDDDDDSDRAADSGAGDDNHGKGASSNSTRKAQNRIAQREFRLRKQQYIRDLEAQVEVLSSDKEERTELTMVLIRNLLKENKDLRALVKNMAGFIGEGLGSCLPRLGLNSAGLDAILNRADTDTAYEAFVNLKASKELAEANPGVPLGEIRRHGSTAKRKRGSAEVAKDSEERKSGTPLAEQAPDKRPKEEPVNSDFHLPSSTNADYGFLFPDLDSLSSKPPSNDVLPWNPYMGWGLTQNVQTSPRMAFGDPFRNMFPFSPGHPTPGSAAPFAQHNMSGFGLTIPPTENYPTVPPMPSGSIGPGADNSQVAPMSEWTMMANPPVDKRRLSAEDKRKHLRDAVQKLANSRHITSDGPPLSNEEVEERRKMQKEVIESMEETSVSAQVMQLITYHLNNFRVNHSYVLPPSLRPTVIQRTIPHEHVIDGCLFPTIRDRMILLRGRYDLVAAIYGILEGWVQHGDDPLDHKGWEIKEVWINSFQLLCDDEVYAITNKWRQHRGDSPLLRPDRPLNGNDFVGQ